MSEVRTAQRLIWLVVIVLFLDLWRRSSGLQPSLNHGHPPSPLEPPSKGSSLLNAPVKKTANNNRFLPNWGQGIKWAGLSAGKVINAGAWKLPCFLTGSCSSSPFRDSQLEKGLLTASALQRESKFQSLKSEFEKGGNKLYKNEFATTGRMKDKESTFGGFASSTVISGPPHDPSPSGAHNFSARDASCISQSGFEAEPPRILFKALSVWPSILSLMLCCNYGHGICPYLTERNEFQNVMNFRT